MYIHVLSHLFLFLLTKYKHTLSCLGIPDPGLQLREQAGARSNPSSKQSLMDWLAEEEDDVASSDPGDAGDCVLLKELSLYTSLPVISKRDNPLR